jgi:hypothetical protein
MVHIQNVDLQNVETQNVKNKTSNDKTSIVIKRRHNKTSTSQNVDISKFCWQKEINNFLRKPFYIYFLTSDKQI